MSTSLLSGGDRARLEAIVKGNYPQALQRRARILLLYDQGQPTRDVAAAVQLSPGHVRRWKQMFQQQGLAIFRGLKLASAQEPPEVNAPVEMPEQVGLEAVEKATHKRRSRSKAQTEASEERINAPSAPVLAQSSALDEFLASLDKLKKPGVVPDDHLAEAGRKVIRYHFGQMLLHEHGTMLGEDIEELHDMRVATRRMRAAVEVFGPAFRAKALKPHLKGLRASGRALGRVRDLDVFMEKAGHYQAELPPERQSGLGPLLEAWQSERATARAEMLNYLASGRYAQFKDEIYKFLSTPGAGANPQPEDPFEPIRVCEIAPVLIYTRFASVRAFENSLETASIEQFHALRIEFKKFRYTLEFFREVLGEEAKAVIEAVKTMQDHLGDLNDAQVATDILRDFLTRWDVQQASLTVIERSSPEPIMAYLTYRYTERHNLLQSFADTWRKFNQPELRQNLARAVAGL